MIPGVQSAQTSRPDSPIPTNCGWIRDLQHSVSFESGGYDAFVLTAAELAWVDMRQARRPLMSVPHRRHPDDHSLAMELFDTRPAVTTAFLHSRFNSLVTTHCFTSAETPALLGPPRRFLSPVPPDVATPVSFGLGFLPCRAVTRGGPDDAARRYLTDENLRFYTGLALGKDLDVTQRVYASQDLCGRDPAFQLVGRPSSRSRSAPYVVDNSDSDSDADGDGVEVEMRGLSFTGTEFGNPCVGERASGPTQLRTDFGALYQHAFTADVESLRTATETDDGEHTIEGSAQRLKALLLKRADKHDLGIISLLNLQQPARLYDRLEDFEARVRALLAEDALAEYQITSLIASSDTSGFLVAPAAAASPVAISIMPLYSKLLETWVHPLPEHTPGAARLRRERLCRMLATETWLSSIGLHLEPPAPALPPAPAEQADTAPEPLLRIRTYANVSTRITLPEGLLGVLDKWEIGGDPGDYEHIPDSHAGSKKQKRRSSTRKRSGGTSGGGGGGADVESWQNNVASQPPAIMVSSQQLPSSSQVVMSQVERGRNGGRLLVRKKRKTGF